MIEGHGQAHSKRGKILPRKKIVAVSETYDNLVVWEIPGYLFVCITHNLGFYSFAICIIRVISV